MPVTLSIEINPWGTLTTLDAIPGLLDAEVEKAMVVSTFLVEAEVKALTPRRTGRLFSAWTPSTSGYGLGVVGKVTNRVEYAGLVEEGTRPHDIVASGRALMIPVLGAGGFGGGTLSGRPRARQQVAFFKKVRHPGFDGRHMARRGLRNAWPLVREEFVRSIKRAVDAAIGLGKF